MTSLLDKRVLHEVKCQIPAELLRLLGSPEELKLLVSKEADFIRLNTLKTIPRSWEDKVIHYIVNRIKQTISEKHRSVHTDWVPTKPFIGDVLSSYCDAKATADDVFKTIERINLMRLYAIESACAS